MDREVAFTGLTEPWTVVQPGTPGAACTVPVVTGITTVAEDHSPLLLVISTEMARPIVHRSAGRSQHCGAFIPRVMAAGQVFTGGALGTGGFSSKATLPVSGDFLQAVNGGLAFINQIQAAYGCGQPSKGAGNSWAPVIRRIQLHGLRHSGPVQLFLRLLLVINFLHLIRRHIGRCFSTPVYYISFGFQGAARHIVGYGVGISGNMAVGSGFPEGCFGAAYILQGPIDSVALRPLIKAGHKADHQLAISKYAGRQVQVRAAVSQFGQALHGIPQCKGFGFIVSPSGAIVSSGSQHFVPGSVQNNKSPASMAILGSSVELHMNSRSFGKPGFRWQVYWAPQRLLGCGHVLQVSGALRRGLVHPQLLRRQRRISNQHLRLVLHQVH